MQKLDWGKVRKTRLIQQSGFEDVTAEYRKKQEKSDHDAWVKKMRKRAAHLAKLKSGADVSPAKKNRKKASKKRMFSLNRPDELAAHISEQNDRRSPLLKTIR
jgi:hypothetical protein